MRGRKVVAVTLAAACLCTLVAQLAPAAEQGTKEPLALQLPAPTLKGTPEDIPSGPNIEPLSKTPPPAFMVPKGVKNVAAGKPVTGSIKPMTGELPQLTDGKKEAIDDDAVELKKGTQWVQVDLGQSVAIYAIAKWNEQREIPAAHEVILLASDDPEIKEHETTLFNNDSDNSSGMGVGTDREYFETFRGRVVDGKGVKARYIRGYTKGSSLGGLNCWQELEVYALGGQ